MRYGLLALILLFVGCDSPTAPDVAAGQYELFDATGTSHFFGTPVLARDGLMTLENGAYSISFQISMRQGLPFHPWEESGTYTVETENGRPVVMFSNHNRRARLNGDILSFSAGDIQFAWRRIH